MRELFHRNHLEEPLRPTTNLSLVAAHLSASMTAHVVGLVWRRQSSGKGGDGGDGDGDDGGGGGGGGGGSAVAAALRRAVCSECGLTIGERARGTVPTLARFERFVRLVVAADAEPGAPLPFTGTALVLRHLWLRSTSRREIWCYLETLHKCYGPVLTEGVREAAWVHERPLEANELSEPNVLRAARLLFGASSPPTSVDASAAGAAAAAFEVMAASLALGGARTTPVMQGRYSYRGQPAKADCTELAVREVLNALLWNPATLSYDPGKLPPTASAALADFYRPGGPADADLPHHHRRAPPPSDGELPPPQKWFELVSNLPGVDYLAGEPGARYESAPTVDNLAACLGVLLGRPDVGTAEGLHQMWEAEAEQQGIAAPGGGRLLRLHVPDTARERLRVSERAGEAAGGDATEQTVVEVLLSTKLNHAFALHWWEAVEGNSWQRAAAVLAWRGWRKEWWLPVQAEAPPLVPPVAVLLPALLQPVASHIVASDGSSLASDVTARSGTGSGRQVAEEWVARWISAT